MVARCSGALRWRMVAAGFVGVLPLTLVSVGVLLGPDEATHRSDAPVFWKVINVPAREPTFLDLRSITGGWQCRDLGYDVLKSNPCDPHGRVMSYPRVWSVLGEVIPWSWTTPLGLAIATLTGIGLALTVFLGSERLRAWWPLPLFAAMPAVLLGAERGNTEGLIYLIVVAAALTALRSPVGGALLLLAGTALKLTPAFSIPFLLAGRDRRSRLVMAAALGAVVLYALLTIGDIKEIASGTPHSLRVSFGAQVLAGQMGWSRPGLIGTVNAAAVIVIGLLISWQAGTVGDLIERRRLAESLFLAAAPILVFSYLLFPSNFDYRLIFVVACVPLMLALREGSNRRWSVLVTICLVLYLPDMSLGRFTVPINAVSTAGAMAITMGLLFRVIQCRLARPRPTLTEPAGRAGDGTLGGAQTADD